jgi:hypothetical protein
VLLLVPRKRLPKDVAKRDNYHRGVDRTYADLSSNNFSGIGDNLTRIGVSPSPDKRIDGVFPRRQNRITDESPLPQDCPLGCRNRERERCFSVRVKIVRQWWTNQSPREG